MDERSQFPSGKNLSAYSAPGNERGELLLPMPFETDDILALQWEKILGFPRQDEGWLYTWGEHNAPSTEEGSYMLGSFTLNGQRLEHSPFGAAEHAEVYQESRSDEDGYDYPVTSECFDGEHGFDCTRLFRYVRADGRFPQTTSTQFIVTRRSPSDGDYKLYWRAVQSSHWSLHIDMERTVHRKYTETREYIFETFQFDFFEGVCFHTNFYSPVDEDTWEG